MAAPTILTQEQLNDFGQRLLALTPGGSEYFLRHGDGYKVDVDACMKMIERRRNDAIKYAHIAYTSHASGFREGVEAAIAKVRHDCPACDGSGYAAYTNNLEDDGTRECEYCGRPMAAIRALLPSDAKDSKEAG